MSGLRRLAGPEFRSVIVDKALNVDVGAKRRDSQRRQSVKHPSTLFVGQWNLLAVLQDRDRHFASVTPLFHKVNPV